MGAEKGEKYLLVKIGKLVEALRETQAKTYAITEELQTLLGGGIGMGETLKRLEAHYDGLWCARYAPSGSARYVWTYHKDWPQMKRLVKILGVEETELRMTAYVTSSDPFYASRRHPFTLFVATINAHARPGVETGGDLELESDVAATKRRQAAMRGTS